MKGENAPIFYLNENIAIRVVDLLAQKGIPSVHTVLANNRRFTDEQQLQFAARNEYVLVTHNRRDFRRLHYKWMSEDKKHSGILLITYALPEEICERIYRFFRDVYPTVSSPFCLSPPR